MVSGEQRPDAPAQSEQVPDPIVALADMLVLNLAIATFAARTPTRLQRFQQLPNLVETQFEHARVVDEPESANVGLVEQPVPAGVSQAVVTPRRVRAQGAPRALAA